jgi:hypothetical protein
MTEPFYIQTYLLLGGPNADGRALISALPPTYDGPQHEVWTWNTGSSELQLIEGGVNNKKLIDGLETTTHGLEIPMGRALRDHNEGKRVLIVKVVVNEVQSPQSGFVHEVVGLDWSQEDEATDKLFAVEDDLLTLNTGIRAVGSTLDIRGIVFWQGDAEAYLDPTLAATWGDRVAYVFSKVRSLIAENGWTQIQRTPVPGVLVKISRAAKNSYSGADQDTIRTAADAVAAADPYLETVDSNDYAVDGGLLHSTSAAMFSLGPQIADIFEPYLD